MTTNATPVLRTIADGFEDQYPSGVNSGIVGDLAHRLAGGYHISIEDQPADNYSVVRPDDKAPPGSWPRDDAAAVDQSMNAADMVRAHGRVYAVWADRTDPRRAYFNAFNVWDGSGDAVRLDFVANTATYASDDHKWHVHGELRRRYVNDPAAGRAWLSMTGGQSKAAWIASQTPTSEEDAMAISEIDFQFLIWRVEAEVNMRPKFAGGPQKDKPVPLVRFLLGLNAKLDALAAHTGLTPAQLAEVVAAARDGGFQGGHDGAEAGTQDAAEDAVADAIEDVAAAARANASTP